MTIPIPFKRTCREVVALVVAREDRALPWRERLALRMHMAICAACPRFERQVVTLRRAMGAWRNYTAAGEDGTPAE
ncbi:zf-HC2 domain-containing protein [Tibeticola sp.]|uniref:zf-HC2 domain-containing protein n=1 Tax=Tibeticola sp. TaxID=2005368 RepID=UPI00168C1B6A|nr:zf-HC2 domain-containing protein [Tibeticola sp.]QLQ00401.1 MAG: zf-HC2 domain-containing protein [Burkholderiaceae bacterium]